MRDVQTESLWSHLLGEAMAGKLKGRTLEIIPSSMTDWRTWKSRHPDTTVAVLSRTARRFTNQMYQDPTGFVIGYVDRGKARAWSFRHLKAERVINDTWSGRPILVVYDPSSGTALLFSRELEGREFHFSWKDNNLNDRETGSEWDWATGKATAGAMQGKVLQPLTGVVSFRRAWQEFHPDTDYWKPADGDDKDGVDHGGGKRDRSGTG